MRIKTKNNFYTNDKKMEEIVIYQILTSHFIYKEPLSYISEFHNIDISLIEKMINSVSYDPNDKNIFIKYN
jgi:hypothetical protein